MSIRVKLSVFDRIVTIVPGIDKHSSVEDVFEHVINGVRVLFRREPDDQPVTPTAAPDEAQMSCVSTGLPNAG